MAGALPTKKKLKKKPATVRFDPPVLAEIKKVADECGLTQVEVLQQSFQLAKGALLEMQASRHRAMAAQIRVLSDKARQPDQH